MASNVGTIFTSVIAPDLDPLAMTNTQSDYDDKTLFTIAEFSREHLLVTKSSQIFSDYIVRLDQESELQELQIETHANKSATEVVAPTANDQSFIECLNDFQGGQVSETQYIVSENTTSNTKKLTLTNGNCLFLR